MEEQPIIDIQDTDDYLLGKMKELHAEFAKNGRQILIVGAVKGKPELTADDGCTIFHIGKPAEDPNVFLNAINSFFGRLDRFLQAYTRGKLYIGKSEEPSVPDSAEVTKSITT